MGWTRAVVRLMGEREALHGTPVKEVSHYGHMILGPADWSWASQRGEQGRILLRTHRQDRGHQMYLQVLYDLGNDLYYGWLQANDAPPQGVTNREKVADCLEASLALVEML